RRILSGALCAAAFPAAAADRTKALPLSELVENIQPQADITKPLDRALQLAQQQGIGEVLLPGGEYLAESITLRSRVKLKGLGRGSTRLKATPGGVEPFVVLGDGPIIHVALEGMTLVGGTQAAATNPSQWAMDLVAKAKAQSSPANGGLWWSYIQDVQIIG